MRIRPWIVVCLLLAGCGVQSAREAGSRTAAMNTLKEADMAAATAEPEENAVDAPSKDAAVANAAAVERKIIYVADISLVVEDFSTTEIAVAGLVKKFGGYLAEVSIDRTTGESRSGRWTARVPVDRFDLFLDALAKLGVPESRRQTAQDVTEEFIDLEARVKNSKRVEQEILKLLEERTGDIKDVLEVQARLGEVRGEIERTEGRLRYLSNRTSLTTVTISAREERDYKPPQAPSFAERITDGWSGSLVSLQEFGENATVGLVVAAPWIALWSVILLPIIWLVRRRWKRSAAARSERSGST